MDQVSDKKIIEWIRKQSFSKLTFLDDCWQAHENDFYLGFYYFVQQLKQNSTNDVFEHLVSRMGDLANVYCYLGDVARQIYSHFDEEHIAVGYYRKAIELDPSHSNAYWGLSTKLWDLEAGMESIRIDYQQAHYDKLKDKLYTLQFHYDEYSSLSRENLLLLKEIILGGKVECKEAILVSVYFCLGEYQRGVERISSLDTISLKTIRPYFDKGLIDKQVLVSKIYDWQVKEFLSDEHELIYQRYVESDEKGERNSTAGGLIALAFRAKAYEDVIQRFEQGLVDDKFLKHEVDARIYYLLAQIHTGKSPDEASLNYVGERLDSLRGDDKSLFSMLRLKRLMIDLDRQLSKTTPPGHDIQFDSTFQAAEKILENSDLLNHFLFEQYESELEQIKTRWDTAFYREQFEQEKDSFARGKLEYDDFPQLWRMAIDCKEYDFAIENVELFHKRNKPNLTSYNALGVCHDFNGDLVTALEYYRLALKLKEQCQEQNYIIISNYFDCARRLPNVVIGQQEFDRLRSQFNADLIGDFKWHTFTAKNKRSLYKYSPFNINTIDSLTNQYFYLAGKQQLNDPIEFPDLEGVGPDKLVDENYRICSLSNNDNSMLMWSHYAQEHQGIMVEYWFGGELPKGLGIGKVSYTDNAQRNRKKEFYTFNQYVLTKNKEWSYEDEVRLFSNLSNKVSYQSYQYPNPDYSKINAMVMSITLGYKFPHDKKALIVHLVESINSKRAEYEPKIVLKEAYIAEDNNFSIQYRDLES